MKTKSNKYKEIYDELMMKYPALREDEWMIDNTYIAIRDMSKEDIRNTIKELIDDSAVGLNVLYEYEENNNDDHGHYIMYSIDFVEDKIEEFRAHLDDQGY